MAAEISMTLRPYDYPTHTLRGGYTLRTYAALYVRRRASRVVGRDSASAMFSSQHQGAKSDFEKLQELLFDELTLGDWVHLLRSTDSGGKPAPHAPDRTENSRGGGRLCRAGPN